MRFRGGHSLGVYILWQAQHFVKLDMQVSWQAQHVVNSDVPTSWLMEIEVPILRQAQHFGASYVDRPCR